MFIFNVILLLLCAPVDFLMTAHFVEVTYRYSPGFAGQTRLQYASIGPDNSVHNSGGMLQSDVSGREAQL